MSAICGGVQGRPGLSISADQGEADPESRHPNPAGLSLTGSM